MSHFFSDIDGRSKYAVMGTPGADISEFLLCILAYESSSIKTTRADTGQVYQMMSQFLKDMVRVKKKSKKSLRDLSFFGSTTFHTILDCNYCNTIFLSSILLINCCSLSLIASKLKPNKCTLTFHFLIHFLISITLHLLLSSLYFFVIILNYF